MIYYFEFDEIKKLYIRKKLGEEELNNNKCFTIDGSGDSFKVIVYCNVELALKPNTIVLSKDEELTNYWWVVQEDKSTLIDTNLYKHELQLVGAIEWFKFKFCYTGTFYYHRYSYYEVMQKLLYGLMRPLYIYFNLDNFKTKFGSEKKNQKFSFKGYTVRSALNEIEKALNVDFKLKFVISKLSIEETLSGTTGNQSFDPTPDGTGAYYPGNISTTISPNYSKVVVKSVYPNTSSATISSYDSLTGAISISLKSARPDESVQATLNCTHGENVSDDKDDIYISSAYFDFIHKNPTTNISYPINSLDEKYQISQFPNKSYASRVIGRVSNVTNGGEISFPKTGYRKLNALNNTVVNKANACLILPYNIDKIGKIRIKKALGAEGIEYLELLETTELIDNPLILGYTSIDGTNVYPELELRLKEKTLYDMTEDANEKKYCLWYEKGKNIIYGFENLLKKGHYFFIDNDSKKGASIGLGIDVFKVFYNPIIDEIIITKSTNISCDDVIYNQTGQNVDAELTKEFIDSYADSISIGTLTKSKYHNKESECFKCGDVFVKDDERYVISSVSIDKYKDVVYAEYKLSKDYVAKTELISADGSIESYAIPQNNIVKRIQEYKTIIKFCDNQNEKKDAYISNINFADFTSNSRNDYVMEARLYARDDRTDILSYTSYYVGLFPASIEAPKTTTLIYDFYDNNHAGFVATGDISNWWQMSSYAQYAYNYVDKHGEFEKMEIKLKLAYSNGEETYDTSKFPYLTSDEYKKDDYLVGKIKEDYYYKDAYETPVIIITREYQNGNNYYFGNNISKETNVAGYLNIYLSENEVYEELTDFRSLNYLDVVTYSYDKTNGSITLKYIKNTENTTQTEPERILFNGKNIVITRVNVLDDNYETAREELMFARNNYNGEFNYIVSESYDEETRVFYYRQTYTWTIYLETYKI